MLYTYVHHIAGPIKWHTGRVKGGKGSLTRSPWPEMFLTKPLSLVLIIPMCRTSFKFLPWFLIWALLPALLTFSPPVPLILHLCVNSKFFLSKHSNHTKKDSTFQPPLLALFPKLLGDPSKSSLQPTQHDWNWNPLQPLQSFPTQPANVVILPFNQFFPSSYFSLPFLYTYVHSMLDLACYTLSILSSL